MKTTTNTQETQKWAVSPNSGDIYAADGRLVARSAPLQSESDQWLKVDAPMIAAVPDLLAIVRAFDAECARAAMNESKPRVSVLARLHAESRAAIAKATPKATT